MKRLGLVQHSPEEWLSRLQKSPYAATSCDYYSSGDLVQQLENQIADLLDKPAALFFSKGMTAQFCMLKVVEHRTNNQNFIMSPYSHLALDEEQAYKHLLGLNAQFPTQEPRPFHVADVEKISEKAASLIVELPLRRSGFLLPEWQELQDLHEWANEHKIHMHMDGARLWESRYYYNQSEAKIAELFDSVYVSLYKGLGGLGGAVLAGDTDFIEECKVWRSRFAGNHYTLFPLLISALEGLDKNYHQMESLVERAIEIAKALSEIHGINVSAPHTNGFFVYLEESVKQSTEELNARLTTLTKDHGIDITNGVTVLPYSKQRLFEVQVGTDHKKISTKEIVSYVNKLLDNG